VESREICLCKLQPEVELLGSGHTAVPEAKPIRYDRPHAPCCPQLEVSCHFYTLSVQQQPPAAASPI